MKNYKVTGAEAQRLTASAKGREKIREIITPKVLARYEKMLIPILSEYYDKKSYNEILQNYLKYMRQILQENRYTDRLSDTTMMIKILRKSQKETTTRKIHSDNVKRIGVRLAEYLGLNVELASMMLELHDVCHLPYGHDGEWMTSDVLEEFGLGCICHNAEGARKLLYKEQISKKVIARIKEKEPNIPKWKLKIIEERLWLVLDGILTHNGEKTDKVFIPNTEKTKTDFEDELLRCYTNPGTDKDIFPATIEGCLLRISDIISYVGRDFVDGLREKVINGIDEEYIAIFSQFGITRQKLESIIQSGEYLEIAKIIEEELINDVRKNSDKNAIRMSEEMAGKMYLLRQKNTNDIVNKVTRPTEKEKFVPAIRSVLEEGRSLLVAEDVVEQLNKTGKFKMSKKTRKKYSGKPYIIELLEFIEQTNPEDYEFTTKIADARVTPESGKKIDRDDAIAILLTTQYIASLTDLEFVKMLRESGRLTEEQVADLHVKYKDIPGITEEDGSKSASKYMQKLGAEQAQGLAVIDDGSDENSGGRD